MKKFKFWNIVCGWVVFAIAAATYLMTIEPTASFWDCGEFISSAHKLDVGHPPGAPFFMLMGHLASLFASDPSHVAMCVNAMSALASAFCILFLFWTIVMLGRKLVQPDTLGKAMQLVLDELNKQESTLTSMFVGKSEVKNLRQSVSVNISDTAKTIQIPLLTFSQKKGPQGAEAEGDAVMLNVKRTTEQVLQPNAKKKNEYEEKIISSKTTITYQNKTIYEKTCNL